MCVGQFLKSHQRDFVVSEWRDLLIWTEDCSVQLEEREEKNELEKYTILSAQIDDF